MKTKKLLALLLTLVMLIGMLPSVVLAEPGDPAPGGAWYANVAQVVINYKSGATTGTYYYSFDPETQEMHYLHNDSISDAVFSYFQLDKFGNSLNKVFSGKTTTWSFLDKNGEPIDLTVTAGSDAAKKALIKAVYGVDKLSNKVDIDHLYEHDGFEIEVTPTGGDSTPFTVFFDLPDFLTGKYAWKGAGTEDDPYLLSNDAQLLRLSVLLSDSLERNNVADKYYRQTKDIDMSHVEQWLPIGRVWMNNGVKMRYAFSGTYDGGGYRIQNLRDIRDEYLVATQDTTKYSFGIALFGAIKSATIKNVVIDDSCAFTGAQYVAGVVAYTEGNNVIENCVNYAEIYTHTYNGNGDAGGVLGAATSKKAGEETTVTGCKNYGKVWGNPDNQTGNFYGAAYVGGVVGDSYWPVVDCANYGAVSGGAFVGGVAGQGRIVVACSNAGSVTSSTYASRQDYGGAGGVVGRLNSVSTSEKDVRFSGCYNTGNVTADFPGVGGLIGTASFITTDTSILNALENSYNAGRVTLNYPGANAPNAGQLIGYIATNFSPDNLFYVARGALPDYGGKSNSAPELVSIEQAEDWMRGPEFLEALNGYETAVLTYATWSADSGDENKGFPVISGLATKQNYAKKILSASVGGVDFQINEEAKTGVVYLPFGKVADLSSTAVTLTVSPGASVIPASGAAVDFTDGPVTYTVTAADGSSTQYALTAHRAMSADGLVYMKLTAGESIRPGELSLTMIDPADFSQDQTEYEVSHTEAEVLGAGYFGGWLISAGTKAWNDLEWSLNGTTGIATSNDAPNVGGQMITYNPTSGMLLKSGENTLTITCSNQTYTIKLGLTPTLSDLALSDGANSYPVTETASGGWRVELPRDVTQVTVVNAVSRLLDTPVTINGGTDAELNISNLDSLQIVAGTGTYQTVYDIQLVKTNACKVSFDVKPTGSTLTVTDQDGKTVNANADGSYTLIGAAGYSYTYRAARAGYRTVEETLTADDLGSASMKIKLTLTKANSGGDDSLFPAMEGDWVSFRSNPENNGVTDALTPISAEHTELIWTAKIGTGYNNAPTPPMLIDGYVYSQVGNKLCRIDPETGETLATGETAGSSNYATNPIACGAGMLFILIDSSNGGVIQAFDAKTLESLWISETIYGQVISPLTYHNGYLYTGTWRSETADGYYFCLPVTDEDPATPDETQHVLWKLQHKGGFYWAGAYATDDYVIFGSDDGLNGYEGQSSTLYSVKPLTGEIISRIDGLTGDIRSAICYSNGKVYFSSKGGYLYQVSVDPTGHLSNCKSFKMSGMATGTPVVYKGVVYASSLNGTDQFNSPGAVYAVDTADMTLIVQGVTRGYNQASLLLSTAYESEGKLYLYGSYNREPGGLEYMVYDTEAKTITVSDLFVPGKGMTQYGICSPICDANGTIYYKNDSGTVFALKNVKTINEQVAANLQAAKAVEEKINAIGEVTKDSAAAITAARSAYNALTADQKALVSNLSTLTAAEAKLAALNNSGSTGGGSTTTNETITVSMRLIGAELAAQDVDLGEEEYLPYYVTWIPTKTYTLDKGATVYDLWIAATSDAGIRSYGADNNYVATIWAPDSLGGYELSEFTNGYRSGWMYTVNGMHPNQGLKYWELHDGDKVVWHYINDYSYECADWFDEPQWPSLGDGTYYSLWLNAPDRFGAKGGIGGAVGGDTGAGGKPDDGKTGDTKDETPAEEIAPAEVAVKPEVTDGAARAEVSAESIAEVLKENKDVDTLTVKVDTDEANKVEATLNTAAVKAAADADIGLNVETEVGTVKLGPDTLGELAEAGKDVAVTVTANDNGTTTVSVTADGEDVEAKVRIELPAPEDGQVLVIVDAEGNETIVKKSATEDGTVYAEIPAGATVKAVEAEGGDYGDVKANAWYAEYVAFVSSHGIFQGTNNGFEPGLTMSRAMLATVLYRLEDAKAAGTSSFDDVKPATWYAEAAAWAEESGIINGTNKGFEPNAPVTREQIATMLYRYAKLIGLDTDTKSDLAKFSDGDKTSSWAQEAMSWAVSVGLFQGDEHGALNPTGEATRAQVAALVERLVKLIVK